MTQIYETYPDMFLDSSETVANENYDHETRVFTVPKAWAADWIMSHYSISLAAYEDEYTYSDSYQMYEDAIRDGALLGSSIVRDAGGN